MLRRIVRGVGRAVLSSYVRRDAVVLGREGLVTFTFDDFPRSAYRVGGQILAEADARGTFYAVPGLMDTTPEWFQREDVTNLLRDGHELGSHTLNHVSCRRISRAAYRADAEAGKAAIGTLNNNGNCDHFAYPFGHVGLRSKQDMGKLFRTCRGIWSGINGPRLDLSLLRANSLCSASVPLERVSNLIDETRRSGGWLIFCTHDIGEHPTKFGCTPQYFERAVCAAVRSGVRIVTVSKAVSGWVCAEQPSEELRSARQRLESSKSSR